MRTTIDLDDTLLIELKTAAARERTTISRKVGEAVAQYLRAAPVAAAKAGPVKLPVCGRAYTTGGPVPDLAALHEQAHADEVARIGRRAR